MDQVLTQQPAAKLVVRDLSDSRKDEGLWDDVISHHPTIV